MRTPISKWGKPDFAGGPAISLLNLSWFETAFGLLAMRASRSRQLPKKQRMPYIKDMKLSVPIPDDLVERLDADGRIGRRVLEAFATEEYRAGRITHPELRRMLGFATHAALDAFLKDRGIYEAYDLADFKRDRADLTRLGL